MPLATLTLATPLTQVALKGTNVTAYSVGGMDVAGRVLVDQEPGSSILQFEYTDPSLCQVGGLGEGDVKVTGCLAADGVISSESGDYQYTYNPLEDNKNGRTLATISQMSGPALCIDGICIESFRDYYGTIIFAKSVSPERTSYYLPPRKGLESFADEWVNAAFEQRQANFENGVVDFSQVGFTGRAGAIAKGTVVLSTFVEIIRLLAKSVASCRDRNMDDSLLFLEAAKCMYTGSLVGQSEDYSGGELMFTLADKMCVSFKVGDGLCFTLSIQKWTDFSLSLADLRSEWG